MVEIEILEKNLADAPKLWNETPSWSNLRDVLKELREASKLYNEQKEQDEKLKQDEALLEEWTKVPIDPTLPDPTMGMPELHLNSPIIHCILSAWEKFPKKLMDALKTDLEIALKDVVRKLTALGFKLNMAAFEGRKAKDKRLTKRGSMWANIEHPLLEIQREISDQTKNGRVLTADALDKYMKEINGLFIEVQREATHVTCENLRKVQDQLKSDDWEEECDHEVAEGEYDYPTLGDPTELAGVLGELGELNELNALATRKQDLKPEQNDRPLSRLSKASGFSTPASNESTTSPGLAPISLCRMGSAPAKTTTDILREVKAQPIERSASSDQEKKGDAEGRKLFEERAHLLGHGRYMVPIEHCPNSDDNPVPALRFGALKESSPFSLSPISLSPQVSGENIEKENINKVGTLIF